MNLNLLKQNRKNLIALLVAVLISIIGFSISTIVLCIGIMLTILFSIPLYFVIDKSLTDKIVSQNQESNIINGLAIEYYPNSRNVNFKIEISNGKRNGKLTEFYKNGKIKFETFYEDGIKIGPTKSYYDNGRSHEIYNIVNGEISGEYYKYHSNGRLYKTYNIVDGKISGKYCKYHSNGNLAFETQYKSGIQYGTTNSYFVSGNIFRTVEFDENSNYIFEKEYYSFGLLKFVFKDNNLIFFNNKGEKAAEMNFKPNGVYSFSKYSSDMRHFLKTNIPCKEWIDYKPNGKISKIYKFINEYNPKIIQNMIEMDFINKDGISYKKRAFKFEFKNGFHANFISDLANVRSCEKEIKFQTTSKGCPGSYNGYTVKFKNINSVLDFIDLKFSSEIERDEFVNDLKNE